MPSKKQPLASGEKAALTLVAKGTCYNPQCSEPLLVQRGGSNIINYEVAHIRDELPPVTPTADVGWRYWPEDLSQEERNRAANLILLCASCHKLIDKVQPRNYTVELLRSWKQDSEGRIKSDLGDLTAEDLRRLFVAALPVAIDLRIPTPSATPDLLSFADRLISHVGMTAERDALQRFLDDDAHFAWWFVTGPAGAGKSRLSLELCIAISQSWHAGFLGESSEEALLGYKPNRPTLVVVDYAAARAEWLGRALHSLATGSESAVPGAPRIRVVVLERTTNSEWLDVALRRDRHHESTKILSHQYALPLKLSGLAGATLSSIIRETAACVGEVASLADLEDITQHARRLDPSTTPLMATIATIDWYTGPEGPGFRDDILRTLLTRRTAQRTNSIPDAIERRKAQNLETVATTIGGISTADYFSLVEKQGATGIQVPDPEALPPALLGSLIDGIRPDLLGELHVLDGFADSPVSREKMRRVVEVGWRTRSADYAAFVFRCASDHPFHANLPDLLHVDISSDRHREIWFRLVSSIPALLRTPANPNVKVIAAMVADAASDHPGLHADMAMAAVLYNLGNLFLLHNIFETAIEMYTQGLASSDEAWEIHSACLTNRAAALLDIDDSASALADLNAVINSTQASDEVRACCLNNRADLRRDNGDLDGSIEDRSAVLQLATTTYNRRFIALVRRATSLWKKDQQALALEDIEAILRTNDITVEQKMSARLTRAEWSVERGDINGAWVDIEAILSSHRNFDDVFGQAQALAADLTA
jgi:hypothetical protein